MTEPSAEGGGFVHSATPVSSVGFGPGASWGASCTNTPLTCAARGIKPDPC